MQLKIYLAHPISGLSGEQVIDYYENLRASLLAMGYEVFQPMTGKGYFRPEKEFRSQGYDHKPMSTNHAILERDNWMVNLVDVVLVDLSSAKTISIGCTMELAWACQLRKHTIVIMEPDNVHRHAFVLEAADIIFETLEEAQTYLAKLIYQEM